MSLRVGNLALPRDPLPVCSWPRPATCALPLVGPASLPPSTPPGKTTHSLGPHSQTTLLPRWDLSRIRRGRLTLSWHLAVPKRPPMTGSSKGDPSSLLSPCPSFCPSTSSSRMWWTNSLCTSANEYLGTLAEYDPLTGYEPNDYHTTEATEHYIQKSSVEQGTRMTSTTMTSPSARRSLTRAVDEPITLKKACRLVCRRQSVIVERRDPLLAVTRVTRKVAKFRDKTSKTNRFGLYWTDKGSKSSLTFTRRLNSTNSRQIITEEVYKN